MFKDILKSNRYKTISVVGLAKNVGKTTTLNSLIRSSNELSEKIGICSIGVDGEKQDVWTYHDKPPVYVYKGMLTATAQQCLEETVTNYRILEQLKSASTMGSVFVVEALEDGEMKLAGTHTTEDVERAFSVFRKYGVNRCFVDGAYDRFSTAKPDLTEASILCVGASISPSFERVIEEAANAITRLTLPVCSTYLSEENVVGYIKEGNWNRININSVMASINEVKKVIATGIELLFIPGGLTQTMFEQLTQVERPFSIVIRDGTRCFVQSVAIKQWFRRGGKLQVLKPITLMAVTVNPASPQGDGVHPKFMLEQVKRVAGPIPVMDCVRGEKLT